MGKRKDAEKHRAYKMHALAPKIIWHPISKGHPDRYSTECDPREVSQKLA